MDTEAQARLSEIRSQLGLVAGAAPAAETSPATTEGTASPS
jgi:hypothetical protein